MGRGKSSFFSLPFQHSSRALIFPSSQPPRVFSQACSQGATVGGLCGGESPISPTTVQAAIMHFVFVKCFHYTGLVLWFHPNFVLIDAHCAF